MRGVLAVLSVLGGAEIAVAQSPSPEERFWISREVISQGIDNCRPGRCPRITEYTTRLFDTEDNDRMRRLMALLDFQSAAHGRPLEHPETPQFCSRQLPDTNEVIWNPEWMKMSDKLEALRGLQGLHVNVEGLKAPDWYEGDFGADLQAELEQRFQSAGIRMVDAAEAERIPGQPKLAVYFSNTNSDTGCWWSVFATLTQTAVLTRDINVKLNVGTWAFMRGYDPDNLDTTEYGAIIEVFDKFVEDFRNANDPDFEPVNVPPYTALDGTPMTAPAYHVKSYDDIVADDGLLADMETAEADADPEPEEPAEEPLENGFTPAATRPELSPKALRRLNLEAALDGDTVDGALEKLTTTGEDG